MPKQFNLLVFDWDGTVIDSAAAIVSALQGACRDLGLAVPDDERARHVIGLGLADALACLLPEIEPRVYPEIAARYRHHFFAADREIALFDGARETIAALRER